jgi:hypothetical protein
MGQTEGANGFAGKFSPRVVKTRENNTDNELTQHSTIIGKFRFFSGESFGIDRCASLVELIPSFNTTKTPSDEDTTETPPKHKQDTQNITEHHQDTIPTHHQSPTKTPTTTGRQLTTKTPAGQTPPIPESTCKGFSPKKMLPTHFVTIFFPSQSSPSTIITTLSQHHHHNNNITTTTTTNQPTNQTTTTTNNNNNQPKHQTTPTNKPQQT